MIVYSTYLCEVITLCAYFQLDFAEERYKVLQTNVTGFKKETSALRQKNEQFSNTVVKHETNLTMIREVCGYESRVIN